MELGWIIFCTMKTIGNYVILVGTFYQLLLQIFSFSLKIHPPIENMIIKIYSIMLFLPSIVKILNFYFKFINSPLIFNSKWQPHRIFWKYRKWFYRWNLKIRSFSPTDNQLLENNDESNFPMTKQHPEINQDILSNLRCYFSPKKHSFDICANSGALYCATPDEIDFIPGTYKHLTGVKINSIAEGIKVAGYKYFSWIFQYYKRENIKLIIEQVLHIPGSPIWLIFPQQISKQTEHIGDGLHAEKYEAHLIFGGLKFTTKYKANRGLPIYNYVNGISKFKT